MCGRLTRIWLLRSIEAGQGSVQIETTPGTDALIFGKWSITTGAMTRRRLYHKLFYSP